VLGAVVALPDVPHLPHEDFCEPSVALAKPMQGSCGNGCDFCMYICICVHELRAGTPEICNGRIVISYYKDLFKLTGGAFAEELGDCTANAKLLQFDRRPTMPVPEPLQLMGSLLNNALDERPFAPL